MANDKLKATVAEDPRFSARRPNIVLYISHDTGRWLPTYGITTVQAPFLESFAAESLVFDQAFATSPICSPSRASMLTSLYPHETGVNGLTTPITGDFDLTIPERHPATLLKAKANYETVVCGPIHEAQDIWSVGFDRALGGSGTGQNYGGDMRSFSDEISTWLHERDPDQPFYLQIGSHETHRDWTVPDIETDDSLGTTLPPGIRDVPEAHRQMAEMQGAIRRMDHELGRILGAIDNRQHDHRPTIIILTTDHGIDMPNSKGTLTDRGLGAFLFLRMDGVSHRRITTPVSLLDIGATILEVANITLDQTLRGKSLLRFADHTRDQSSPTALFAEKTYHDTYDPMRSIRTAHYRYVRYFDVSVMRDNRLDTVKNINLMSQQVHRMTSEELFRLDDDPKELNNIAHLPEMLTIKDRLATMLAEWMLMVNDPLLSSRPESPAALATRQEFDARARQHEARYQR